MKLDRKYLIDLGERVLATFAQAFGAQLIASGFFTVDQVTDLSILQKAGVAGIAAVLAVLKGLVAAQIGKADTAALLPKNLDSSQPGA